LSFYEQIDDFGEILISYLIRVFLKIKSQKIALMPNRKYE